MVLDCRRKIYWEKKPFVHYSFPIHKALRGTVVPHIMEQAIYSQEVIGTNLCYRHAHHKGKQFNNVQ